VGTISQSEKATTAVVAAPVEEARAYVHEQSVAHLDQKLRRRGKPQKERHRLSLGR
jgi:hypothetical protein